MEFSGQSSDGNCTTTSTGNVATNFDGGKSNFENSIYLTADYPNECGLTQTYTSDFIQYSQTVVVTYGDNPNSFIQREEYDNYTVTCNLNRTVTETLVGDSYNVQYRQTGVAAKSMLKNSA